MFTSPQIQKLSYFNEFYKHSNFMAENAKGMMTDGHEHYSVLKSYP